MKQELKHILAYLPHGVQYTDLRLPVKSRKAQTLTMDAIIEFKRNGFDMGWIGLHLHPLSDITEQIEHDGEMFVPIDVLDGEGSGFQGGDKLRNGEQEIYKIEYASVEKLIEWHFNIFGLDAFPIKGEEDEAFEDHIQEMMNDEPD